MLLLSYLGAAILKLSKMTLKVTERDFPCHLIPTHLPGILYSCYSVFVHKIILPPPFVLFPNQCHREFRYVYDKCLGGVALVSVCFVAETVTIVTLALLVALDGKSQALRKLSFSAPRIIDDRT